MKRISLLAVSLLVVGMLAGCGDDAGGGGDGGDGAGAAGAPKDATVEEFCAPFVEMYQDVTEQDSEISDADAVKIAKDTADKLAEAGTPEDMPEDARKGGELVIDKLTELDEDSTKEEVEAAQNLTEEEQRYSDALARYVASDCADAMAAAMGGGS